MRKGWRLSAPKIFQPIPRRQWRRLRLSNLHVDHGLLHGLKHLCLHSKHLLKSRQREGGEQSVDILVVLPSVVLNVFVVVVPFGHLKYKDW
jgi:hypothetical protein